MTEVKIRKQISVARFMNQIAVGVCGSCCIIGGAFGALGLAAFGLSGTILVILCGSLLHLFMAQRALSTINRLDDMKIALNEVVEQNPGLEGPELVAKVIEKIRDKRQPG